MDVTAPATAAVVSGEPERVLSPEQPYGPGAACDECGHFAARHDPEGCHLPRPTDDPCTCAGMLWLDVRWPRPWLPAPEGLTAPASPPSRPTCVTTTNEPP